MDVPATALRAAVSGAILPGVAVFWAWATDDLVPLATLSTAELQRASRYRSALARREFITGAFIVRIVASRILGTPVGDLEIDRGSAEGSGEIGPPRVTGAPWLSISVTHSAGRVGVAFGAGARVGLDVESVAATCEDSLIGRACSHSEREFLASVSAVSKAREFTRLWCRKEATLKAYGVGLAVPPASLDVLGIRPVVDERDALGIMIAPTAQWLPISEAGRAFASALLAADPAELANEVCVDDLASLPSATAYAPLMMRLARRR